MIISAPAGHDRHGPLRFHHPFEECDDEPDYDSGFSHSRYTDWRRQN